MKIVVLDGNTVNPGDLSWSGMEALGDVTVHARTADAEIIQRIGDARIVLTNKTPLSAATIKACPHLRYIGVLATGYNIVDIGEAKAKNIPVCNVPDYATGAVAQFVFALLLEICHRVGHHNDAVQKGRWTKSPDFAFWDYPLIELAGKTLGLIGFGRIGQATAGIARAFGMEVIAYNPSGKENDLWVPLDEVYARSDVISLHTPLYPENAGMISKSSIAKMKDGVILINTSRGGLVNEADLREALVSGKVSAAAVDVVSREPIREDNPLLGLDNCIITPHIAWANHEARARLMEVAVGNLSAFLKGETINRVW